MKKAELDRLLAIARARADAAGGVAHVSEPLATIITVAATQLLIDGGSPTSFFELEFEGQPPYSFFIDAYRRIGATEGAAILKRLVDLFPFESPHLHQSKRGAWLEEMRASDSDEFWEISDDLMENPDVWAKLTEYIDAHRDEVEPV